MMRDTCALIDASSSAIAQDHTTAGPGLRCREMALSGLPFSESNVHNLEASLQALHRIITHRWPPLMGHKSGVPQIRDRIGDEPEVEFLFVVDFQAAGHSCDVNMADMVNVVVQRPRDVPIHNLSVVDVIKDFHSR